jgi:hypothetical protein
LRRQWAKSFVSLTIALGTVIAVPIAGQATQSLGGSIEVTVPSVTETHQMPLHPCIVDRSQQCYGTWGFRVPAHRVFRRASARQGSNVTAPFAPATTWTWPSDWWDEYAPAGVHLYHAEQDTEVWYDGGSTGVDYNDRNCSAWATWSCGTTKAGVRTNGGQSNPWMNISMTSLGAPPDCVYLRIWVNPDGFISASPTKNSPDSCP